MNYVSLYRKWRSQNFDEIVGQKHIIQTLKNAISQNRIAHAYLFCGPRGTGKTSIARIFAKALNCENGPTVSPCTKCKNCQKIRDGQSVDVIEIDAASNRGIDEIRDLREKVRYAPVEGKYKVYIIDEVHMLTSEAFNALLKTLEEPPSHVVFILATTESAKVPVTIESRCQRLDFARITLADVKDHLMKICKQEKFQVEEKALDLIARAGEGSMRDSVSLLDQVVSFSGNNISVDNVVELMGSADEETLFMIAKNLWLKDVPKVFEALGGALDKGRSANQVVKDSINHFRNLLFVKIGAEDALEMTDEQLLNIKKESEEFDLEFIKKAIKILSRAELDMKWHPHSRLVLEVSLLEIMEDFEEKKVEQKITQQKTVFFEPKKIEPQKPEVQKIEPAKVAVDSVQEKVAAGPMAEIKGKWSEILDKVKKVSLYGYVSLHEGEPRELSPSGKLVISFRKGYAFHKERLEEAKNKQSVESIIKEVLGKDIKIECRVLGGEESSEIKVTVDSVKELFEGELV